MSPKGLEEGRDLLLRKPCIMPYPRRDWANMAQLIISDYGYGCRYPILPADYYQADLEWIRTSTDQEWTQPSSGKSDADGCKWKLCQAYNDFSGKRKPVWQLYRDCSLRLSIRRLPRNFLNQLRLFSLVANHFQLLPDNPHRYTVPDALGKSSIWGDW